MFTNEEILNNPDVEAGMESGLEDPTFAPMRGTEDASPEDEQALGEALNIIMEFAYSNEGMAAIVEIFNQDDRELYEQVPDIGAMLLQKAHTELTSRGMKPSADIFFGDGGLLQQVPPLLFEIAEQIGKPGAEDDDQLAAATIGLYKKAGEHVLASKDDRAIQEALSLGEEVLLQDSDGTQMSRAKFTKQELGRKKKGLEQSVKKGLLEI